MENEKIMFVNPKELVTLENSRWRVDSNLNELMESIKQHGILQPIVVREEDNVVVCGNRRLGAILKLELDKIPVRYIKNISNKELMILNLTENMQRKDISSIEIGKMIDTLLKNKSFKINEKEIAVSLGISYTRVKVCLLAFKSLPEKYRKNIVYNVNSKQRKNEDLPEAVLFAILNFSRYWKATTSEDVELLIQKTMELKLSTSHINLIGILVMRGMPIRRAIKEIDLYEIKRLNLPVLKTEMVSVMKKQGTQTSMDTFTSIIREKYPNLLF
jgi:ParB/RepB/Spo0J family partition protein